ncbi:universal stress protein [Limimaricola pyoseonensis]|uniref:Nucleotide-binding universal stress protein, UspA family n=1 Tax=Limimaricola pyoseonensis TaxID=521013 RepID=A0A1G7G1U8_9RHOB|nr:universal stress protein [Limimaricola pyoseonensis]SDE82108.1 Nucleotide-binding universal stress protein, UspA family [Limimaricola pyoseonensis]
MRILIATDLSERSDRALARARMLAETLDAPLDILHVVDDALPSRVAEATAENARLALRAGQHRPETVEVGFGQPWRRVMLQASEGRYDLLVMGAHRDRGFLDLLRGSVVHRCTQMSPLPVLVVAATPTGAYDRVTVGTSFSARDAAAARLAARLAPEARMTLVHSYHVPFRGLAYRTDASGDLTKHDRDAVEAPLRRQMDALTERLAHDGLYPQTRILEGGAAPSLLSTVAETRSDLLAIGRHQAEGHLPMRMGRVAAEMLSYLPCDLLVHPGSLPAGPDTATGAD